MPRLGFAYQLAPRTTLRGGYGIFFDTAGVNKTAGQQAGFSQATPIQASINSGLTYVATNANPLPSGLLPPRGAEGGLSTNLGQSVTFYPEHRKRAYVQRWSFGVQQQVAGQFLVEATCCGNRGTRQDQPSTRQHAGAIPQHRPFDATRRRSTSSASRSRTRFSGTAPYDQHLAREPAAAVAAVHGRERGRASRVLVVSRVADAHRKRFSHGYTVQLSYTWSKAMQATEFLNPTDPRQPYESISDLDRTHHLVITGIWDLPIGRGRRFGDSWSRPVDFLLGGWQLNGVVQRQSGPPLAFGDVWTLFTGDPDNVKLSKDQRNPDRWFNVDAGFNKNSAQALASNLRVSPLRFSGIRGDGQSRWDFSLIKSFVIREDVRMQYRAECINAFNHPNLFAPNTNPTSSAFGTITGKDVPRLWQMSLTLKF
jgi:hypothetical protein